MSASETRQVSRLRPAHYRRQHHGPPDDDVLAARHHPRPAQPRGPVSAARVRYQRATWSALRTRGAPAPGRRSPGPARATTGSTPCRPGPSAGVRRGSPGWSATAWSSASSTIARAGQLARRRRIGVEEALGDPDAAELQGHRGQGRVVGDRPAIELGGAASDVEDQERPVGGVEPGVAPAIDSRPSSSPVSTSGATRGPGRPGQELLPVGGVAGPPRWPPAGPGPPRGGRSTSPNPSSTADAAVRRPRRPAPRWRPRPGRAG